MNARLSICRGTWVASVDGVALPGSGLVPCNGSALLSVCSTEHGVHIGGEFMKGPQP